MAQKLTEHTNGFDPAILGRFVKEIDRYEAEMATKQSDYMRYCKGQRELISGAIDRAKDAGVPKKELKAVLKARKLEKKIKEIRDELEKHDAADTFDMIRDALGDLNGTPLGRAAMGERGDEGEPAPDQTQENVTRLQAGVKPLKG